jgi:AcrR family transcriptional regulator
MARRDALPRKAPTQARAKHTVDAILRAAAHILRTSGYEACTTNAVAKKAGVSIGSLYQYFPSKEALVAALAEAHADQAYALLLESVQQAATQAHSIEATVRHYIRAMIGLHHVDPKLHRVLTERVPRLGGGVELVRRLSERAAALVRAWLESQQRHFRPLDLEVATFVLVTSVEAVTHLVVLQPPSSLRGERLIDEVSELVLRYLGVQRKRA